MTAMATRGRPRLISSSRPGLSPAEEILDAAAELFTGRGYAATSTRMIAERAGLRQASLYHYFRTKQSILETLLLGTVEPTLRFASTLTGATAAPAPKLHALIVFDTAALLGSRWNLGALYLLPEVRTEAQLSSFVRQRSELRATYTTLTTLAAGPTLAPPATDLPFRLVESVINMRFDGVEGPTPAGLAEAAFRAVGLPPLTPADHAAATSLLP